MKMLFAGACVLALAAPAWAAEPAKTETFVVAKGTYSCKTCTPAFTVKADGNAYPIKGDGFDGIAVRLTSNGATEIRMKGAKVVSTINTSVSSDRRTATTDFTDTRGAKPAKGFVVSRRVEASPKGDNPVSGSWTIMDGSGDKLTR